MSALTLMAQALADELRARDWRPKPSDCEAIMRAVVARTAEAGERLEREVAGK